MCNNDDGDLIDYWRMQATRMKMERNRIAKEAKKLVELLEGNTDTDIFSARMRIVVNLPTEFSLDGEDDNI